MKTKKSFMAIIMLSIFVVVVGLSSCEKLDVKQHIFCMSYREKTYMSDYISNNNDPMANWNTSNHYGVDNPWAYIFWFDTSTVVDSKDYPYIIERMKVANIPSYGSYCYWRKYGRDGRFCPDSLKVIGCKIVPAGSPTVYRPVWHNGSYVVDETTCNTVRYRYWIVARKYWRECSGTSNFWNYNQRQVKDNETSIEAKRQELLQKDIELHGSGDPANLDTFAVEYQGLQAGWR